MTDSRLRAELKRRLAEDGRSWVELSEASGLSADTLWSIRSGRGMPLHETVVAIADALGLEGMIEMSLDLRRRPCDVCGTVYVDMSRRRARLYCTKRCLVLARLRRNRGSRARKAMVDRHRLEEFQAAVVAYCHGCEPQGICRDDECALRPVSPLAFIPMSDVGIRSRRNAA